MPSEKEAQDGLFVSPGPDSQQTASKHTFSINKTVCLASLSNSNMNVAI